MAFVHQVKTIWRICTFKFRRSLAICIICLEFQKGTLTKYEARQALLEMIQTENIEEDHMFDVADLIEDGASHNED